MSSVLPTDRAQLLLGPLTTTFTTPTSCATAAMRLSRVEAGEKYPYLRNRGCGGDGWLFYDQACWPATTFASEQNSNKEHFGLYSSGWICPAGYTSACTATASGSTESFAALPIMPGETRVGCCPSGFACSAGTTGQGCWTVAGFGGKYPVQTCSEGSWIDQSILSLPHTSNDQITSTYPVHAPMIEIRWRSPDRPATLTSNSRWTSRRPQATVSTPAKTSGFSTGTKAAIGVVIPIATIAAFFAALVSWRRYRKRRALQGGGDEIETSELHAESLVLQNLKVESDVRSIHEVEGQGDLKELGGADIVNRERYELPADFL